MMGVGTSESAQSNFSLLPSLKVCSVFSQDIYTEIFTEEIRDKIFETEIVAALGRVLGDTDSDIRSSAVNFFSAATAQSALCVFHGQLIPRYSQMGFGTRYLILRSSPHWDVH